MRTFVVFLGDGTTTEVRASTFNLVEGHGIVFEDEDGANVAYVPLAVCAKIEEKPRGEFAVLDGGST